MHLERGHRSQRREVGTGKSRGECKLCDYFPRERGRLSLSCLDGEERSEGKKMKSSRTRIEVTRLTKEGAT